MLMPTPVPYRSTRRLFTCEHGGRGVPSEYAGLFAGAEEVLASHRSWDRGALEVFNHLAAVAGDVGFAAVNTRLLVDLNRSLRHPRLFSEFTRPLPRDVREDIVARWWRPWRERVLTRVDEWLRAGHPVRHISVHSFTPVLRGETRNADIGLLYDPARDEERAWCAALQGRLAACGWRVRLNYPYRGVADGHTSALRRRFTHGYTGIELELNQALFPEQLEPLCADLLEALADP